MYECARRRQGGSRVRPAGDFCFFRLVV